MRRTLIAAAAALAVPPLQAGETVSSGTAFNPEISVIFDGVYYRDSADGNGAEWANAVDGIHAAHGHDHDHGHAHDHGGPAQGFSLRETEIALSGSIGPYFDGFTYLTVSESGGVELEEAYLSTRRLPAGLTLKAGRFLSDFGYHNVKHPHEWDFVDQNLAYGNLLGGHGIMDTGVQLAWLTPLPTYLRVGVEALQAEDAGKIGQTLDEEAVHETADDLNLADGPVLEGAWKETFGPRLYTAFAEWSPDLGFDHALQLGTSLAWAPDHQELHGDPDYQNSGEPPVHLLDGSAWTAGLEAVYKYDHADDYGAGDLTLQAEYLYQVKDLDIAYHQADSALVGDKREFTQDGAYLQGVYGIAPRWEAGLRYDVTGLTNEKAIPGSTSEWDASDRTTAAVTFHPSEFSQIRLQAARADLAYGEESRQFNQLYLQYEASLGSHGAHSF